MKPTIDPQSAQSASVAYRHAENLTQRQLAKKLNTTRGIIGAMERGRVRSRPVARAVMALVPTNLEDLI